MRTGAENKIELFLLRHGAAGSNEEGRYLGRTDESLSENGRKSLLLRREAILREFPGGTPDFIFSGPMKRCRETADLIFGGDSVFAADMTVIPEWTETDFGDFEGKNYQDLCGNPDYQAWIDSGGTLPFPGGESREEFIRRSMVGFERMLCKLTSLQKNSASGAVTSEPGLGTVRISFEAETVPADTITAAAVVHGGTIMAIMSTLTGGEYFDFHVKNGEGYRLLLEFEEKRGAVLLSYEKIKGEDQ